MLPITCALKGEERNVTRRWSVDDTMWMPRRDWLTMVADGRINQAWQVFSCQLWRCALASQA